MKAKVRITTNLDEIERAVERQGKLGMITDIPDKKIVGFDFLFNIEDVKLAHLDHFGGIVICIGGDYFEIEYDQNIWDSLNKKLNP